MSLKFGDPAAVAHKFAALKQHCEVVGRDYESIRRIISIICVIADTDELAIAQVPETLRAYPDIALIGSPETIRKRIAEYEAAGVQELVISFPNAALDSTRRFAEGFIEK
jgi:alkanesulfonate monooxygenase SsuD/methylene tetrahydromethanopterin reductase-like flavin-dependent oxidoreductase (luciferase family)